MYGSVPSVNAECLVEPNGWPLRPLDTMVPVMNTSAASSMDQRDGMLLRMLVGRHGGVILRGGRPRLRREMLTACFWARHAQTAAQTGQVPSRDAAPNCSPRSDGRRRYPLLRHILPVTTQYT